MDVKQSMKLLRTAVLFGLSGLFLASCGILPERIHGDGSRPVAKQKIGRPYKINGVWYRPARQPGYDQVGIASWYGSNFHGKPTANGEIYDMEKMTAAHTTLPLPSYVEVTNLSNGAKRIIRINDRGPFVDGRLIDLSRAAARELDFLNQGLARVRVRLIDPPASAAVEARPVAPTITRADIDAFVIQLGSFANADNAARLALKYQGRYPAYILSDDDGSRVLKVVRLGPFSSRAQAEQAHAEARADGLKDARIYRNNG